MGSLKTNVFTEEQVGVAVRSIFNEIRKQIARDIKTIYKIGGPGTIVEIYEPKFGGKNTTGDVLSAAAGILAESKDIRRRCSLLSALRTLVVKLHSFSSYSGSGNTYYHRHVEVLHQSWTTWLHS